MRSAWADVDLSAVAHNVEFIAKTVAPAALCAVVKADGYGHGAVPLARAALAAGAEWLAVALADEGAELRAAGITAPVLLLSEPRADEIATAIEHDLALTLYTRAGIEAAAAQSGGKTVSVHLKIDTGMHRVGAAPDEAVALATLVRSHPELRLDAVWTHCATADEPDRPETGRQAACFEAVLADLTAAGLRPPMVHAANSAAAFEFPDLRFDLVRAGIAIYGVSPGPAVKAAAALRPALSLTAKVSFVKPLAAGEGVSYGHRWHAPRATTVATVPLGYADGVRRDLGLRGGCVLIGGRRHPIVGVVTMDQLLVDCGDDAVDIGDDVVLIGRQGDEAITADEWAAKLDTIGYEVVCAISDRIPRRYTGGPTC